MMKKYRDCRPHHTAPEDEGGRLQLPITKHMNILEATCFYEKINMNLIFVNCMQSCIYNEFLLLLKPQNLKLVCIFFSKNQDYLI